MLNWATHVTMTHDIRARLVKKVLTFGTWNVGNEQYTEYVVPLVERL